MYLNFTQTCASDSAPTLGGLAARVGVDSNPNYITEGGLQPVEIEVPVRQIYLLQRKTTPLGISLGKTSGWVHRAQLKNMRCE